MRKIALIFPLFLAQFACTYTVHAGVPGAVDVANNAEATIDQLEAAAQAQSDRRATQQALKENQTLLQENARDLLEQDDYLKSNERDKATAQKDYATDLQYLAEAKKTLKEDTVAFHIAYQKALVARAQIVQLEQEQKTQAAAYAAAVARQKQVERRTTTAAAAAAQRPRPQAIEAALKKYNYNENYLGAIEDELNPDGAKKDEAVQKDEELEQAADDAADAAQEQLDAINDQIADLQDIIADSDSAYQDLCEAKKDLVSVEQDCREQRCYLADLLRDRADIIDTLSDYQSDQKSLQSDQKALLQSLSPYQNYASLQTSAELYSWRDDKGHSGLQFIKSNDFSMTHGKYEYAVSSGSFFSDNRSFASGREQGTLDTSLHFGIRNFQPKNQVTYAIDCTLPTGRQDAPANSAMSTDLVPYDKFSNGFSVTPSINIAQQLSENATLLYSFGLAFKNHYRYADVDNKPGIELDNSIGYQHITQKEQFLTQLFFTYYGRSHTGSLGYQDAPGLEWHNTYNRRLDARYSWPSYLWLAYARASAYDENIQPNGSQMRLFFGTGIEKRISAKEKLRLMFHFMHGTGNDFDPVTQLTFSQRNKYALRLSCQKQLSPTDSFNYGAEYYQMHDGGSEHNRYQGLNLFVSYTKNF